MTSLTDEGPRLLRGGPIGTSIREGVATDVAAFREEFGYTPALAVVVVGKDAPSAVYLHKILDGCRLVGIQDRLVELGDDCSAEALGREILALGAERTVAGIIVQQPLPSGIPLRVVIDTLDPAKDIDGIHPLNAGLLALGYDGFLPATAHAAVELLAQLFLGRERLPDRGLAGARAPGEHRVDRRLGQRQPVVDPHRAAGVAAWHANYPTLVHDFFIMGDVSPAVIEAAKEAGAAVREALG